MAREDTWDAAKRKAMQGFTGPLEAVKDGDFQEALRLIALLLSGDPDMPGYYRDIQEAENFLARLQPNPLDAG